MKARALFGTAGWSYPDWKGRVYPRETGKGFSPLRYLAGVLDVIEINSSFYRPPAASSTQKWAAAVADVPEFRFTAKLFQGFTHREPSEWVSAEAEAFTAGLAPLVEAGRLGALLAQFPFWFRADEKSLHHLSRIAERFALAPLVLEVRDASFLAPRVLERLSREGWSWCTIDLPRARNTPPAVAPPLGPIGYLRLHGRNADAWFARDASRDQKYDYLYSREELATFVPIVAELEARCERTYVVTNNHYAGKGVVNALELKHLATGERAEVPEPLLESYPRLQALAREERA